MILTPLALLLGLAACSGDEDDGFSTGGHHSGADDTEAADDTGTHEVEDTAPPIELVDDGTAPTGDPSTLDLDEVFDAVWVRCETGDDGATWTFHAELDFSATEVTVALSPGETGYELWYLQPWNVAYTVWEVEVPPGFSAQPCADRDLEWTALGESGWESSQTTTYTAE